MVIAFCICVMLTAAAAGISAGRLQSKKALYICGAIMVLLALLSAAMGLINCDTIERGVQFGYLRKFSIEPFRNTFWLSTVTECRLFLHLIILNFVLACGVFLLSFNIFGYCRDSKKAVSTLILFMLGSIFSALLIFPFSFIVSVWIVPCKTDFFSILYGDIILPALYCTACVLLLLSVEWTVFKRKRKLYQAALKYAAVGIIFYLAGWLTALNCQRLMTRKAAELKIQKMSFVTSNPPEYEKLRTHDFYRKYPLYSPPLNGVHSWEKNEIDAEKRKFTLGFFDSQAANDLIKEQEKVVSAIDRSENYFLGTAQIFRILTRTYCERAYLFRELKQTDKIIPELMRYIDLDKKITAENQWLINFLVQTACRNIWFNSVIKYAPDNAEYAQDYRKMLDFCKTWQVHLPHEAGFFLGAKEYEKLHGFQRFYCKMLLTTAQCRGFFYAVKKIDELKAVAQQKSFKVINGQFASAAYRQRMNIVEAQISLALKCYRVEKGQYPLKLEELVPEYLTEIPPSPATGSPIFYQKTADAFILNCSRIEL